MKRLFLFLAIFATRAIGQVRENDVQYYLWNSNTSGQALSIYNYGSLISDRPVKMLIHGWRESINVSWYEDAINNYLILDYNVICVDWSIYSQLGYITAVSKVNDIGYFIASFVIGLYDMIEVPINDVHIVGFSLGAHIAGFTGKNIMYQSGLRLGRITGLDPARITFTYASSSQRLDKNDAERVDTVMTDAGGAGITRHLGHVNFLPNGGTAIQPGCYMRKCSHIHSCLFFTEGILSNNFVSHRCSSYIRYTLGLCNGNTSNRLGENVDFSETGDFYLKTNSESPFAQG